MLEYANFGRTGHASSRVIFGAAALGRVDQDQADEILEILLERGVNHIDTAAGYGDSELRIAPWMAKYRSRFFLATKTGERSAGRARESLERSLARMRVDSVDLIQLHNLVEEEEWQAAFGPGGAVEGLIKAREEGLTRFIGVTGHGTRIPHMHMRSLERFAFDSVLFPYNFKMLSDEHYRAAVEELLAVCEEKDVAVQTIKSIARRRWPDDLRPSEAERRSWYQPLEEVDAITRAVHYVLARRELFLNSSSDYTLLGPILDAASSVQTRPSDEAMQADAQNFGTAKLFDGASLERI